MVDTAVVEVQMSSLHSVERAIVLQKHVFHDSSVASRHMHRLDPFSRLRIVLRKRRLSGLSISARSDWPNVEERVDRHQ